jgi:hypothetical protein
LGAVKAFFEFAGGWSWNGEGRAAGADFDSPPMKAPQEKNALAPSFNSGSGNFGAFKAFQEAR